MLALISVLGLFGAMIFLDVAFHFGIFFLIFIWAVLL